MKHHGRPLNGLMTGATRVMIVDDEADIVEVLERILEDEAKYEVEIAKSGFMAGITAEKSRPHVILLDMHLKDIDGREVAKVVKSNPGPAADEGDCHERHARRSRSEGPRWQRL